MLIETAFLIANSDNLQSKMLIFTFFDLCYLIVKRVFNSNLSDVMLTQQFGIKVFKFAERVH